MKKKLKIVGLIARYAFIALLLDYVWYVFNVI